MKLVRLVSNAHPNAHHTGEMIGRDRASRCSVRTLQRGTLIQKWTLYHGWKGRAEEAWRAGKVGSKRAGAGGEGERPGRPAERSASLK
jgi:hypothetical protein